MVTGLAFIEVRSLAFKKRNLIGDKFRLAIGGIAGTDELFQSEVLKILGEETGKIAPLWIIAGEQNDFISEYIGIKFQISIDFFLNIVIKRIKFIIFCRFCPRQVFRCHHQHPFCTV